MAAKCGLLLSVAQWVEPLGAPLCWGCPPSTARVQCVTVSSTRLSAQRVFWTEINLLYNFKYSTPTTCPFRTKIPTIWWIRPYEIRTVREEGQRSTVVTKVRELDIHKDRIHWRLKNIGSRIDRKTVNLKLSII